jgi:hypothetical protein
MTAKSFARTGCILTLAIFAAAVTATSLAPSADAYSQDVRRKCRGDYKRLCPSYSVDSDQLRACMRSQHRAITNICMNALVDAGEAPSSARR